MNNDLEALIKKGRRSLVAAKRMHSDGDFDFAISRAYYAMFYLTQALLSSLPARPAFVRHSGGVAAFHREFVRTGKFGPEHHAALQHAMEDRNIVDYQARELDSSDRSERVLRDAEAFVGACEAYLRRPAG